MNESDERSEELLKEILSVQSYSDDESRMDAYISEKLKTIEGVKFHKHKCNFYIVKGSVDYYPCVVAHKDTVHSIRKHFSVLKCDSFYQNIDGVNTKFNINKPYFYAFDYGQVEQAGIGGDDKCGIYVVLEMLMAKDNIKAVIFRQEEVGCLGSKDAKINWFNNVGYIFQADRKGSEDFIRNAAGTELFGDEFETKISQVLTLRGFKPASGSITDVMQLKEHGINVCMANISSGYYEAHSDNEYVVIQEIINTKDLVSDLIDNLGETLQFHEYKEKYSMYNHNKGNYSYGGHKSTGYWMNDKWTPWDDIYGEYDNLSSEDVEVKGELGCKVKNTEYIGFRCPNCYDEMETDAYGHQCDTCYDYFSFSEICTECSGGLLLENQKDLGKTCMSCNKVYDESDIPKDWSYSYDDL